MRYLHCQQFEIDTHHQQLRCAGLVVPLAPKVYDLLVYFFQNPQRVISKDELMEQVWAGTIVTDNAISRTLVKVRRALGDDPKTPQFIVTVPRKGYCLTQVVTASEQPTQKNISTLELPHRRATTRKTVFSLVAVLLVGIGMLAAQYFAPSTLHTKSIKPLTRDVGQELFPAMSPDLTRIAYTNVSAQGASTIVIEQLGDHQRVVLSLPDWQLSRLAWSPDGKQVAFVAKSAEQCVIYKAALTQVDNVQSWQRLSACGEQSAPHLVFSPIGKSLFFNDRVSLKQGYQIFRLDLATGKKEILNQPITAGKGNYAFDIAPNGKSLVMLNSEFAPVTAIYTLSLDGAVLTKTGQLNYLMRSVVFSHDSESIVHPSPHPAYELWQSSLAGEKRAVVASNTSRVKHMQRVNNGQDYVFVSYLLNRDLVYHSFFEQTHMRSQVVEQNNSSVMDYLPALANHSSSYAFVSKRSTGSEVYLVQKTDDTMTAPMAISSFEHQVKLYHLAFSFDDSKLLVLADNQLFVVDIATKTMRQLPLNNQSIQAASWQSNEKLLFSSLIDNRWHMMLFDLTNDELTDFVQGYVGGLYLPAQQQYALVAQQSGQVVLLSAHAERMRDLPLVCQPALSERKLNLHRFEQGVLCPTQNSTQIQYASIDDERVSQWGIQPETLDFSVNKHGILATKMTQAIADVMVTISP
ncbi:hypothetical protein PA25_23240 [Pseudoalteromonas sp. A25]|uniref:winged helix-turn-helix domain-containing protein n=1 Tax=Pseudoalteromonas sp. A25 TaxID=116092 RepID=UPI001260926A|nr:winged helix-turn-helix domain-containing protein [Pseudoalteromonas sp. A25]BBN82339.1 hypothetical protein PA25_23240 [Pseudoalteromonas sp. A25]